MEEAIHPDLSVGVWGHSERPAFADLYAVAGRFISIESTDGALTELVRRYFNGWHVNQVAAPGAIQPDARIRITADNNRPQPPAHLESFEVAEGGVCRTDERTYFFESNQSVVRADYDEPPCVEVWVGNEPGDRERTALARLIFNSAMTAMRRCGLFELHAAGVVNPDGVGVLIIGPSGSSKSTLAIQMADAGWQYLSDDSLLLYREEEVVHARALRRVFALSDETFSVSGIGRMESLETETLPFDPLKKRFEPRSVFPDRFTEVCEPRVLLFSRVTRETESRTTKLSQGETMAQLIRMCPWACYDKPAAQAHLNVLATLARQARGYELLAGTDLFGDAEHAANYLRSQTQ
ncbi:MAG TPA: hypothetical protein VJT71_10260 [Pyrinomonadaceae bacterium]|nr:hypothetical protein [Pyrinomonadaceae bacterium]